MQRNMNMSELRTPKGHIASLTVFIGPAAYTAEGRWIYDSRFRFVLLGPTAAGRELHAEFTDRRFVPATTSIRSSDIQQIVDWVVAKPALAGSLGLGSAIKSVLASLGFRTCASCAARQRLLDSKL